MILSTRWFVRMYQVVYRKGGGELWPVRMHLVEIIESSFSSTILKEV